MNPSKHSLSSQESSGHNTTDQEIQIVPISRRKSLQSLARTVSPPPSPAKKRLKLSLTGINTTTTKTSEPKTSTSQTGSNPRPNPSRGSNGKSQTINSSKSLSARIEAGETTAVKDEASFYTAHLEKYVKPPPTTPHSSPQPRIPYSEWTALYDDNANSTGGRHFVIHQHDHPIAGTHYDLRLQCNPTSSISFAIMYGVPGDPNSRRLNRNATETRVHCLWNHVVETGSLESGSMGIWDTGVYEVLPYYSGLGSGTVGGRGVGDGSDGGGGGGGGDSDGEGEGEGEGEGGLMSEVTEQEKLKKAFARRKIKLRLHGTRLPKGYTLALRLTKDNDRREQPGKPSRRRKKKIPEANRAEVEDSEEERRRVRGNAAEPSLSPSENETGRATSPPLSRTQKKGSIADEVLTVASDDDGETMRVNNAYAGATNDIGSIHQRKWYLSVDRAASGFIKKTEKSTSGFTETVWVPRGNDAGVSDGEVGAAPGFDRFVVGGRETERSVVTGRLAGEIMADEGVVGFVPRGLWRAVTE